MVSRLSRLVHAEYILQPYLTGAVFVVDVVREQGGRRSVAVTRQELVRTPNGAGTTVMMHPEHPCGKQAVAVVEALNLVGCVNVEFLGIEEDVLLMDINPRFSAGVGFSVMAGYDMVVNHMRCFMEGGIDVCDNLFAGLMVRGSVDRISQE